MSMLSISVISVCLLVLHHLIYSAFSDTPAVKAFNKDFRWEHNTTKHYKTTTTSTCANQNVLSVDALGPVVTDRDLEKKRGSNDCAKEYVRPPCPPVDPAENIVEDRVIASSVRLPPVILLPPAEDGPSDQDPPRDSAALVSHKRVSLRLCGGYSMSIRKGGYVF